MAKKKKKYYKEDRNTGVDKRSQNRLFLVTPLKDEMSNIPALIKSIESQTIEIFLWVIVENDSEDGSREYLEQIQEVKNVNQFVVLNLRTDNPTYDIGYKISKIYQHGLNYLEDNYNLGEQDYIGILDSDSFPQPNYFERLTEELRKNENLGLVSGILKLHGSGKKIKTKHTVRGSNRVWKYSCFEQTGEYYGLSADSITQIKAELEGWNTKVIQDVYYFSRKISSRGGYFFNGQSAYYNGQTFVFIVCKGIYKFWSNPRFSINYLRGYLHSYKNKKEKNPDLRIINYYQSHLKRVVKRKFLNMMIRKPGKDTKSGE